MEKQSASNRKIKYTLLSILFSILFIFTALNISTPLTTYAGNESGNGTGDAGSSGTHIFAGGAASYKSAYLIYIVDGNGNLLTPVVEAAIDGAKVPPTDGNFNYEKSKFGNQDPSRFTAISEVPTPFSSSGDGNGAVLKSTLLSKNADGNPKVDGYITNYFGAQTAEKFRSSSSDMYLIFEGVYWFTMNEGNLKGQTIVATASGWAKAQQENGYPQNGTKVFSRYTNNIFANCMKFEVTQLGLNPCPSGKQTNDVIMNYMGYIAYNRRKNGHANSTRLDRKEWTYAREQNPEIAIVSQELWERAQEIREARKNKINAARQATNELYMEQYNVPFSTRGRLALTGMVYCGYCGKRLKNTGYANHWTCKKTGEKKVSYVGRYGCPNGCKPRSTYSQEYLESIVFATVETYLENLKKIDISKELEEMQTQQGKTIKREIKDLEKEIKNLLADIETLEEKLPEAIRGEFAFSVDKLSAIISDKESLKKEKEIQKKSLQKQLEEISLQSNELMTFVEAMPKWNEIFSQADVQTKQMILSTLIDKIIVKDDDITIKFKIRLDNFLDEKLLESSGVDVPEQRL